MLGVMFSTVSLAQSTVEAPANFEEAKGFIQKMLDLAKKNLPNIVKNLWRERVLPIWQKMYEWADTKFLTKLKSIIGIEIEKRKPIIEEDFEKEKEELKEELPIVSKSLWQRLKALWE